MKELYLAGNQKLLTELFLQIKGVESVEAGQAVAENGQCLKGIKISYNPKKQDICGLLQEYFAVVDPFAQTVDVKEQSAIFYTSAEDVMQLEYYARFLQSRGHEPDASLGNLIVNDTFNGKQEIRPLAVRFGKLKKFTVNA